ncbi:MAG: hypothetical protein QXG86_01370 [Candidatus Woesearchaeota archaeon]
MAEYATKSVIIGRKKDAGRIFAFIALFDINDPHKSAKPPKKILEFAGARNVRIYGCDIKYMLAGNDIIINDLEKVQIEEKEGRVIVRGCQEKNKTLNLS